MVEDARSVEQDVPFSRPWIDETDIARVGDVLRSGWWTTGSVVREFEERFAEYVGSNHAVGVNSCTAALHLALAALGVGAGDVVVTTTWTFAATAEVIAYQSAVPVLLDVESDTLNMSADQFTALCEALAADAPAMALRQACKSGRLPVGVLRSLPKDCTIERVKAVIPVHFAGQSCDMRPIVETAERYAISVIEDAAHAVETTYGSAHAGTIGRVGAFSFYATKNLSTGEGGMVIADDEALAERMRQLSLHGISKDAWKRYTASGSWRYDIVEPGFKYNMTDVLAALGVGQLSRLAELHARRLAIVASYEELLADARGLRLPQDYMTGTHAWHLYVARVCLGMDSTGRDALIEGLRARRIGTSVHFIPLHLHSHYGRTYGYAAGDFPVAEQAFREVVSLPLYPSLTDSEVERVAESVREVMVELA